MGKLLTKNTVTELTIIVNETDDLIDVLLRNKVDVASIRKEIKIIAAKTRNNKIGYARFHTRHHNLKLIVCPKIFDYDQEKFLAYLNSYFHMLLKYPRNLSSFNVENTVLELAQSSNSSKYSGFDELLETKYLNALDGIYQFFKKYKTLRPIYTDYASNDLAYELNLQKTIEEIDKSKIHQHREISDYHTFFAEIALSTLKQFKRNAKSSLQKYTLSLAQKSIRLLSSKFKLKSNAKDYKKLFERKSIKVFKSAEEKKLYTHLLTLLGKEDFFNANSPISNKTVSEKVTSVFFEANSLYELHVYEFLINKYGSENVSIKPFVEYSLQDKHSICIKNLKAEPDFLVKYNENLLIVDAKWKLLKSFNSSFIYDYLKLQRDADLFDTLQCLLVYPSISVMDEFECPIKIDTNLSRDFCLKIEEVTPI